MLQRLLILSTILLLLAGCAKVGEVFDDKDKEEIEAPQPVAAEELPKEKPPEEPPPKEEPPEPEPPQEVPQTTVKSDIGNLLVIGEVEHVYIGTEQIRLTARIDTGAQTSSLGASEITPYESDGRKWVRFEVVEASGKKTQFKRPLSRTVRIKRHNAEGERRPVVRLPIRLGTIKREVEFTLADRSNFEYPALIGRNFLKGSAVVDVNRQYSATPMAGK